MKLLGRKGQVRGGGIHHAKYVHPFKHLTSFAPEPPPPISPPSSPSPTGASLHGPVSLKVHGRPGEERQRKRERERDSFCWWLYIFKSLQSFIPLCVLLVDSRPLFIAVLVLHCV